MSKLRLAKNPALPSMDAIADIREKNDFEKAADVLRNGDFITEELRRILADKISGNFRGKTGPEGSALKAAMRKEAYLCYTWLNATDRKKGTINASEGAKCQVAEVFSIGRRRVDKWFSALDLSCDEDLIRLKGWLGFTDGISDPAFADTFAPLAWKLFLRSGRKPLTKNQMELIFRIKYMP